MSNIVCNPELLTFRHLKDIYGIPRTSAYRYMQTCGFPTPIQLSANAVRFRRSDVEAWIDSRPQAAIHGSQEDAA